MRKLRPGVQRVWDRLKKREEARKLAEEMGRRFGEWFFRETPFQRMLRKP